MIWLILSAVVAIVGAYQWSSTKPAQHQPPAPIDKDQARHDALMERIRRVGVAPDDLRNLRHHRQ